MDGDDGMEFNRRYLRIMGWLYLALFIIGLFDRHLYYVLTLPPLTILLYLCIGLASLTIAHKTAMKGMMIYNLVAGSLLVIWGITGTLYPALFTPAPLPLDNALHTLTGLWAYAAIGYEMWLIFSRKSDEEDTN